MTRQHMDDRSVGNIHTTGVDLAEHDLLELVVERQHTSTSNTTENVGTGTLEERLDTLLGDDLQRLVRTGTSLQYDGLLNAPEHWHRTCSCSEGHFHRRSSSYDDG